MTVTLPVPVSLGGPPAGSGLLWIDTGVGAKPARWNARLAASISRTKWATWSRKISSPMGSWRSFGPAVGITEPLLPQAVVHTSQGDVGTSCATIRADDQRNRSPQPLRTSPGDATRIEGRSGDILPG